MDTVLQIVVALAVGYWLGWKSCNSRWIDAANHLDSVHTGGETFFPTKVKKWRNK